MLRVNYIDIEDEAEEIRLCLRCRRKGAEESMDAQERPKGLDNAP